MPYTVHTYPQGTFNWTDVMSTDIEASKKFMVELMGWTSEDRPTDQGGFYTMFFKDGETVAGGGAYPPTMQGMPSVWNSYISVDNLDDVLEGVEKIGGSIKMPAMDVMKAGRMAGIKDPTGAHVMLWQAGEHIGATLVNTIGAMGWNELRTTDVGAAKKFYGDLLGWTYETDNTEYTAIMNNGRMNGGMMLIEESWGEVPPHWATYFTVKNIDETTEKVKELGGSVMGEIIKAPGIGRFAMVADTTQAHFTVIQLETDPDHWPE